MMSNSPTGRPIKTTIAPNLVVPDGVRAIDFYTAAFGAVVLHRVGDDAGVAQLSINGAEFWLAAGESDDLRRYTPASLPGRSVGMILTVEDPDAVWRQAVAAGAAPDAPVARASCRPSSTGTAPIRWPWPWTAATFATP